MLRVGVGICRFVPLPTCFRVTDGPLRALGNATSAPLQGLVLDPSGAAVPDAGITVTLNGTGAVRTTRTGPDGRYQIPALAVGSYTIRCEKPGFQRAEVPQVYLALNQTLEQTVQLKLASAGSTIDVREQPEALNTTAPTAGTGISGRGARRDPSQNRSYLGVVLLAPGVAPANGSSALRTKAGVRSASPDSGFSFAGMRARNNSLAIDGLDNRDETTGSSRVAVGQEAVAEFRVTASNVAPEFGARRRRQSQRGHPLRHESLPRRRESLCGRFLHRGP